MSIRCQSLESAGLADQIERSFHGGAWHGPSVWETASRIDSTVASRPAPAGGNTIVQLVRHLTFWLNAVHARIFRGEDVDANQDWKGPANVGDEEWRQALEELEAAHTRLHTALLELDDPRLDDGVPGTDPTVRGLLLGTLQHNAYHTGQMVALSREARS